MAILAELRASVAAGDWDAAARLAGDRDGAARIAMPAAADPAESIEQAIGEYRRELESILELARGRRREMGAALARVRAANGFKRQGFGASPGF